jgi:hypothetical protein
MPTEESLKRYARAYGPQTPEDVQKRLRQLEDEVRQLRTANKTLRSDLDKAEDLRDSVFHLAVSDFGEPKWPAAKSQKKADRLHKPILFTSDFQYGEVVNAVRADDRQDDQVGRRDRARMGSQLWTRHRLPPRW